MTVVIADAKLFVDNFLGGTFEDTPELYYDGEHVYVRGRDSQIDMARYTLEELKDDDTPSTA